VQATLHFPFGYKLLAAPGADSANGSWIANWSLLDVFLCAIVALLAWRLFGMTGAAIVVAYLVLGYQESGSPLWSVLVALGLGLIARALPDGKLRRAAGGLRVLALLVLVLWALPFIAQQVREAVYPQLEATASVLGNYSGVYRHRAARYTEPVPQNAPADDGEMQAEEAPAATAPPAAPPAPVMRAEPKTMAKDKLETVVVTGSSIRRADIETANPVIQMQRAAAIDHYSQNTVVQTGKGMPSWNLGSTASLSWSGPVVATQSVHLLVAPPWLVRLLRLVLVALLAWLIVRLVRDAPVRLRGGAALGVGLIALCGMGLAPHAQAQGYPSNELLQQLRTRLSEAPKCAPACVSVAEAQVGANGDSVSVALEAHVGERVALPLPNDAAAAMLKSVQVDGSADDAVARDANGVPWLALGRGVHRVQLEFATTADKVALAFPLKPARVLFAGHGWDASGLSDDRLLTETLTLARARQGAGEKLTVGAQQFPPYVEVTRSILLGLEWSTTTNVRRIAPRSGGFTIGVPILTGEHVMSRGAKVVDGRIEAAIADGSDGSDWDANLDKGTKLVLTAPALADRAEVWRVTVSPTWHVEFSGVPGVGLEAGEDANDYRNFEFHPLPGETLTLDVTRPEAAQGAQRAIDAVNLHSEAGQHASTHTLAFTLRASQGGDQAITLPKDAEMLGVMRDNETLNLRALDGKLTLPVVPGTHRYTVRFRDADGIGAWVRTPELALGLPAANISIVEQLPGDRWLLAAWGPAVGPAVLYWGELVVMVLVAYALARTRRTRLGFLGWLLLGLGFSTFSWFALLIVVAWLFAFDWRRRAATFAVRWRFNLTQIGLALLTLVALLALASAIPQGLLGSPDMHVTGNGSYAQYLQWFADRSDGTLPRATALSLPLWMYKLLMLAWALWLANAVIGWLRDGFAAWTKDGYWRTAPAKPAAQPPQEPQAS
jgi:hypothetical protein